MMASDSFAVKRDRVLFWTSALFLLAAVAGIAGMACVKPTRSDLYPGRLPKGQVGSNFVKLYPKDVEGCSSALAKMLFGDGVVNLRYWTFLRRDDNKMQIVENGKVVHGAQRVYVADRLGLEVMVSILVGDDGAIFVLVQ